jgi:type VI secretion system secreted protein Hcp
MANPVYLWLKDHGGANIKGSVTVHEREGSIEVLSLDHAVSIPSDKNTGKLTGPRIHEPFKFTKAIDSASVYLLKCVTLGQALQSAKFQCYTTDDAGLEAKSYSILLEGVKVVSVTSKMQNFKDPKTGQNDPYEEVELGYEKISWLFNEGNISHSDSWSERRSG